MSLGEEAEETPIFAAIGGKYSLKPILNVLVFGSVGELDLASSGLFSAGLHPCIDD